jgi:hypothetical protein
VLAAQPQADLRGLKVLVAGMGVLIVLGTALVIGVVVHRMAPAGASDVPRGHGPPAVADSGRGGVNASLPAGHEPAGSGETLPVGERIKSISPAGPDVAVWVSGANSDRILLLDPLTGQVRAALRTAP